jgi:hypothetical protein
MTKYMRDGFMNKQKRVKSGEKVGPGIYVCVDCRMKFEMTHSEQDLRHCPACACEMYDCFPINSYQV